MGSRRRLEVVIAGDGKGAKDTMDDVENRAGGLGSRLGSALGGAAKVVGVAAIAGVAGIGVALKGAWDAAEESAKIARETERVIKTTGGAAGVTADQVGDLAEAISDATGADDELIQSAENLLLTFTNVKNVAGQGNDVFNQATRLSLDMATALGTDASGAAIQLGKALNDPVKGITALSKAGVSFTEEQKNQIKTLQQHGDVLGAQKIVLAELSKEFGGAAEAAGTPLDKLKVKIGNFQEAVGAELIPIVNSAVDWISGALTPAFEQAQVVFGEVVGGVRAFATVWMNAEDGITSAGFAGGMETAAITLRHLYDEVSAFVTSSVLPALSTGLDTLRNAALTAWTWVPTVSGYLTEHREILIGVAGVIGGALILAIGAYTVSMAQAAVATIAATWPILAILAAVGALAAGVYYLWNNWDMFRNVVTAVVTWLVANVPPVFEQIKATIIGFYNTALAPMIGYITANSEAFANIGKVLLAVVGIIVGVVVVAFAALVVAGIAMTAAAAAIAVGFVALIGVLYNLAQAIWDVFNRARDALGATFDALEEFIQVLWDVVRNVGSALGSVEGIFQTLPSRIVGAVGDLGGLLVGAGRSIIEGLVRGFESALGGAKDRIAGGLSSIRNLFPFSPAKEGPFSGRGWTTYSGQAIAEGLAAGMMARGSLVYSAADELTRAAQIGPSSFGQSGGAGSVGMAGVGGLTATGSAPSAGGGLTVNLYGVAATKADVGRALDEALREYQRQGGNLVSA